MEKVKPIEKKELFTDFAKCRIVLEALMVGIPIVFPVGDACNYTVKLVEGKPYIESTSINTETDKKSIKLLGVDEFMTLSNFMEMCKRMDNKYLILLGGTIGLNKIYENKRVR